jgi:hypothetical protein
VTSAARLVSRPVEGRESAIFGLVDPASVTTKAGLRNRRQEAILVYVLDGQQPRPEVTLAVG